MRRDVLIVGGGLIGSSIAWRLAQKGAQVTLADARNLGGEASPAGAGMLTPRTEWERPSVWLDLGTESMQMYPAFVEELRAETGVPIDFQICGGVLIGASGERRLFPDQGIVDPADLLRAVRCACEKLKVRVIRERVSAIKANDYGAVVIAAGAWSGLLNVTYGTHPVTLPATVPVKGHLIGFDLEPGLLGPFVRHEHTYVLQRSNGFVIAGSNEEEVGFNANVDLQICADLHRRAARLFPPLEDATPVKRWIGFRPRSADGDAPHIGRMEGTNVWLAYGHYRNGILLTPLTARRVADEIGRAIALRGA
jgi:glycine oxidase